MEIILKYKNRIAIGISVIAVIILIIFLSFKFSSNSDKEVAYDFSKPYTKIEFIKDEMYIFEKNKFLRFNKNGKLKLEKEIENNGKIRVSNDVIYSLMPNEIIMYSKNFDEIKRISLEKEIQDFIIENNKLTLKKESNDVLIEKIAKNVNGASYKVAQCCVLYMRGYYCGIMPVDSGMKDIELPCIGFEKYNNAIGHDNLRKQLQLLIENNDLKEIIVSNGYENLNIPDYSNATWWAHLVLIYFKRHYCNKHNPKNCPLINKTKIKCLCKK